MTSRHQPIEKLSNASIDSLLSLGLSTDGDDEALEACLPLFDDLKPTDAQQLITDLRRSVVDDANGPLSFQRLVRLDQSLLGVDRSFLDVITDESSTSDTFDAIAAYGRILIHSIFPHSTRRTGAALLAGAKTALAIQFGNPMSSAVQKTSARVIDLIE